jgi:hypothetical protein
MQELKQFIQKTFSKHIISEKDNDIIIQFKREDNTIQSIYAQVFKLKTGEYVFNLVGGSLDPVIANTADFKEFKKKVKAWSLYV